MAPPLSPIPPQLHTVEARSSFSCTHGNMTRLYDHNKAQRCMICFKVPDFGYLYRCTQDTDGDLPASDFVDGDMASGLRTLTVRNWAGTYPSPSSSSSEGSPPHKVPKSNLQEEIAKSEGTKDDNGVAVDEDLARAFEGKRKFEAAFPPSTPLAKVCNLKICHNCRPILRDRAWQSLNRIVDRPVSLPPQYELENRRVSDSITLSGIRLPSDSNPPLNLTSISRVNVHSAATDRPPQMRQVSDPLPSIFARSSSTSVPEIPRELASDDGASDADDEASLAKDDSTGNETDTSDDAESSYHFARSAARPVHSTNTGYYAYPPDSANRARSGTAVGYRPSQTVHGYGSLLGSQDEIGGRDTAGQAGEGPKRVPQLSKGRFYID